VIVQIWKYYFVKLKSAETPQVECSRAKLNLILIGNFRNWMNAIKYKSKLVQGIKKAAFRSLMEDLGREKDVVEARDVYYRRQ